jgi:hypothetical protein
LIICKDACNSYPSQQQYLTNRNRSPNKNNSNQRYKYNNNNKKTYGRSSSNHTVQKNNSSFEFVRFYFIILYCYRLDCLKSNHNKN